jgi:hypothetical protein
MSQKLSKFITIKDIKQSNFCSKGDTTNEILPYANASLWKNVHGFDFNHFNDKPGMKETI